jgi:hypothetical protein
MKYRLLILSLSLTIAGHALAAGLVTASQSVADKGQVTETLNSYDINLDTSLISWQKGSDTLASGVGLKSLTLTANAGLIDVTIEEANGQQDHLQINLTPTQPVDILWEADSQVPPFYRGKRLPVGGGTIKFWTPAGTGGSRIYDWSLDGRKNYSSGVNKNTLTTRFFGGTTASVNVSDPAGQTAFTGGTITVTGTNPRVILYQQQDNGQFEAVPAAGTLTVTQSQATLKAVPMFFTGPAEQIIPSWQVNGQKLSPDNNPFIFDIMSDTAQEASVEVNMVNPAGGGSSAGQKATVDFRQNSLF